MLKLVDLSKENGNRVVLNKINLEIRNHEFFCLLGASGSGKTALLRIISGLENADSGTIILDGENITNFPAYKRNVNTVFNSFSIFPELSLYDNVKYGLNFKKIDEIEKEKIVNYAIDFFELATYHKVNVNKLDGLIKYKIVLARALINNPSILLLDDSLKLLDNKDRIKMRYELKRLQKKLNKTFCYITDDVNIAFSIADRVGILQYGVLHQCDTPQNIYEYPSTYFVAGYIGNMNFFYAKIISSEIDHYVVEIDDRFYIKTPINQIFDAGSDLFYAIRPERMQISTDPNISNQNAQKGIIIEKNYSAEYTQYFVQLEYGKVITVSMLNYLYLIDNRENEEFDIGQEIYVKWNILTGDLVYA